MGHVTDLRVRLELLPAALVSLAEEDGEPDEEDQQHHAPHHAPDHRIHQATLLGRRRPLQVLWNGVGAV